MREIHYINELPVEIEYSENTVRITFDTLSAEDIDSVLEYITKVLGEKPIVLEPKTIEELAELTFNDILIRKIYK